MTKHILPPRVYARKHHMLIPLIIAVICGTFILIFVMASRVSADGLGAPVEAPRPTVVHRATPRPTAVRTSRRSEQRTSRYDEYRAERCLEHPTWCATATPRPTRAR